MLKAAHRKNTSLDDELSHVEPASSDPHESPGSFMKEALAAIRSLTDPPRTPVYLALYEGYTAPEIASMLDAPVGTVYSWIARGKKQLREVLE
jgi:RNA polymerase sigma-70 factor (ECF subfamily)